MQPKWTFWIATAALAISACGHARVVRRAQYGGTLAFEGDRGKASEDAHRIMVEHCQGPYTILEEGEHVVGQDTVRGEETYVDDYGNVVTESGTTTRAATEWRVQYACGENAAPPPEPGPPQGPPGSQPPGPPPPPNY